MPAPNVGHERPCCRVTHTQHAVTQTRSALNPRHSFEAPDGTIHAHLPHLTSACKINTNSSQTRRSFETNKHNIDPHSVPPAYNAQPVTPPKPLASCRYSARRLTYDLTQNKSRRLISCCSSCRRLRVCENDQIIKSNQIYLP